MDYEGDVPANEDLQHGRTIPIHQIYVHDSGVHDPGRKECQGFLATRGRADDIAAGILHGEGQVQGDEGLIFGYED